VQGYSKGSVRPFIPIHYNDLVEDPMQGYSKGSKGSFILVHYIGKVEASM
jgi:hypothetical protein